MTSEKQIRANQRNAQKSSGPKTPKGKAVARLNATKHGLLSQEVLLPGEDEAALKELGERLREELQPVGEMENLLVEQIISAYWRMSRLRRVEAGIFTFELYGELAERARREAGKYSKTTTEVTLDGERLGGELDTLTTTTITDEQKYQEALQRAQEMESVRDAELATLGQSFIRDANGANTFSKLSRYEAAIERSLYRAFNELQRLQATRRTQGNVPPPAALDIDVST